MNYRRILDEADKLKLEFDAYRQNDNYRIREALEIEYPLKVTGSRATRLP